MLSVITTGRDDNYGSHFVESMLVSLGNTINILSKLDIQFELLIIDWSPINDKLLSENALLKSIKDDQRVKFFVVNGKTVESKGLNPKNFYEYFGKNAGVRQSNFEWLLIQNPDILITEDIVRNLKSVMSTTTPDENKTYYRYSRRINTNLSNATSGLWVSDGIKDYFDPVRDPCQGAFGGDLLFVSKKVFCELGKGYDESNPVYRSENFRQASMDTEILMHMTNNGAKIHVDKSPYGHIDHGRPFKRQGSDVYKRKIFYENAPDWGHWVEK